MMGTSVESFRPRYPPVIASDWGRGRFKMAGEKERGEENKLFYTGKAQKFVREIWQIHIEHVDEEICVRPKVSISVRLSY